jgi:hypothetical protein
MPHLIGVEKNVGQRRAILYHVARHGPNGIVAFIQNCVLSFQIPFHGLVLLDPILSCNWASS